DTLPFLENSNVGVSFVPCTPYYDCQPPTKTYEYLIYGLPVIATNTLENRRVIHETNGVLIEDTEDGFCEGIEFIIGKLGRFNSASIQIDNITHSWANIVDSAIKPYIENHISGEKKSWCHIY
ncbi:MAG: hypothetical protein WCJ61_13485, partial [Paludibacter sp.]